MTDDPLTQLFLQCRCSDGTGEFARIIAGSQNYAYLLAYRLLLSKDEAKDIVQEAFIRVWQHRAEFNGQVKFTTWLYSIVSNLCKDRRRTLARRIQAMIRYHLWNVARTSKDIENETEQRELSGWILKLANELPDKQKLVFILRDLQDLDIGEISIVTGQSPARIKSNLYHARKFLRQRLVEMKIVDF